LQAGYILNIIENALKQLDARLDDVIRTRIYLRNVDDWQQVAKAHKEYFGKIKPVCTMVAVSSMINPDILVEIEATAVLT
jgi:enamine deaminase RidA (YjgF/YER057c/UK114 family)